MQSPLAVANGFLELAKKDGVELTPLKLNKLVYLAHAWHLALFDEELLDEYVEAWKYGPVVPSVYHTFKRFGNGPVSTPAFAIQPGMFGGRNVTQAELQGSSDETQTIKQLLETVWKSYGKYSAAELSAMTHRKGTPWYQTWHHEEGSKIRGKHINNDQIGKYFRELLPEVEQEA